MLVLDRIIVGSDEDLEICVDIVVGFDDNKDFVVELYEVDYTICNGRERRVWAVVEKNDAVTMADFLKVRLTSLPEAFDDRFGEESTVMTPSYVKALFKDILEFILDCHVQYKLKSR